MAEINTLKVEPRTALGSQSCRQMRKQGRVPGNVYGLGLDSVAVSATSDDLEGTVRAGTQVVQITDNGADTLVMFREVQWDTFGTQIRHFDLLRIDPKKKIEIEIPVDIRGVAPGTLTGGVLDLQFRTLTVRCAAYQIPENIPVRVGQLEIGQSIQLSELEPIEGAEFLAPADAVVVQVNAPVTLDDEEDLDAVPAATEPEVIGRDSEQKDEE